MLTLTPTERAMATLMKTRQSDSKICKQLGLDLGAALAVTASLRAKLACGPAEALRDAIRRAGL